MQFHNPLLKEKGLLYRPPCDPKERLFNPLFIRRVGLVSLMSAVAVFAMFLNCTRLVGSMGVALAQAQTVAFTTLIMVQLFYFYTARSVSDSILSLNPFSNKWVLVGTAGTIMLHVMIVYSDAIFGFSLLRTHAFPAEWWIPNHSRLAACTGYC